MNLRRTSRNRYGLSVRKTSGERTRTDSVSTDAEPPEMWLRLERAGSTFIGWTSVDGINWAEVARKEVPPLPVGYLGGIHFVGEPEPRGSGRIPRARVTDIEVRSARVAFVRGDCNADGSVDLSDAACILNWLFAGGGDPGCLAGTNTNGDAAANVSDVTYLLNHLFGGGDAPVAPFPDCGPGTLPADEQLGCVNPPDCR